MPFVLRVLRQPLRKTATNRCTAMLRQWQLGCHPKLLKVGGFSAGQVQYFAVMGTLHCTHIKTASQAIPSLPVPSTATLQTRRPIREAAS